MQHMKYNVAYSLENNTSVFERSWVCLYIIITDSHSNSVYEKLQSTRAKVAPVNLIYGSHFSATEATYKVSQNMRNFVEFTRTFTRITHSKSQYKA